MILLGQPTKNYIHDTYPGPNGVRLHFFYKNDPKIIDNWKKLQPYTGKMMEYFNSKVGLYPYKQYSVAQGGDGGMEYAMMTLITGGRSFNSLFGVTCHELAHSWFQHVLATNETKHEWMDEGFTTFISTLAENEILEEKKEFPMERRYNDYYRLALSGTEMPQSTNANRYEYNYAYENTAYDKGAVFLSQLGYIVGEENLFKTLQEYFDEWKFKHPKPNDFRRVAERVSGIQLQWYLTDWTQTTNVIDYKIEKVVGDSSKTKVILYRKGLMPMPLEVLIKYTDGQYDIIYIPISLMRGEKNNPYNINWKVKPDWFWANPYYNFELERGLNDIEAIVIDPSNLMADIDKTNNYYLPKKKMLRIRSLKNRKLIDQLFGSKLFVVENQIKVCKDNGKENPPFFCVSVPKRCFKRAVDRNKVKRRIKSALNNIKINLNGNYLITYNSLNIMSYHKIEKTLTEIFKVLK